MKQKYIVPKITIIQAETTNLLAASATLEDTEWNPGIGDNNGIFEEDPDNPLIDEDLG